MIKLQMLKHRPSYYIAAGLLVLLGLNLGSLASKHFRPVTGEPKNVGKSKKGGKGERPGGGFARAVDDDLSQLTPMPNSLAAGGTTAQSVLSKSMQLLAAGKYEEVDGVEAVWQLPPPFSPRLGVMFIAHGCNHGAVDWWPSSASCPKCIGLPEEMNVTLHCLLRGYTVVAVSSSARQGSRCWQSRIGGEVADAEEESVDRDWMRVRKVLDTLLPREGLASLPLFALGASSGGAFVLQLPLVMPGRFKGLAVQIMGGPPGVLSRYSAASPSVPWPPTLFAHMERDTTLAQLVALNLRELSQGGVPTREIRIQPQPLTPLYLAQRCAPEVDEQTSRVVFNALKSAEYIDPRGYLLYNPRSKQPRGGWRAILQEANVPGLDRMRLQPDASPISEELNLLFAIHELSSEVTTDILNWFEQEAPASSASSTSTTTAAEGSHTEGGHTAQSSDGAAAAA